MSKKKSFSGSTMTLKDFHGGSIPSDLPLPSAPGVTARPPDRPVPSAWGRPDLHRPRPGSAGGTGSRALDDRGPPFLSHIGRHFDEDERKPFDASAATPRRPASDPIRPAPPPAASLAPKRPVTSPAGSYYSPAAAAAAVHVPIPVLHHPSGPAPNAWAARRDLAVEPPPPANQTATVWSGPAAASRLAHASAIEKVSSGRWHSKPPPPDVEVIRFHETEVLERSISESFRITDGEVNDYARARPVTYLDVKERNSAGVYYDGARDHERVLSPVYAAREHERVISPVYPEAKERDSASRIQERARSPMYQEAKETDTASRIQERARSPMYQEAKERNAAGFYLDGARPTSSEGKFGGAQMPQQGIAEVWERPKLNLLPKTKLLEPSETRVFDDKQGYKPPVDLVHVEKVHELHGGMNVQKPGSAGSDAGGRAVERPRLNLKPRSLPVEQSVESAKRERKTVFGGARPRELVLKERGIDNFGVDNIDGLSPANKVKKDTLKNDSKMDPATRHGERAENYSPEQRNGRDGEKGDAHRVASWRNDNNSRNPKEMEKPQEPRRQEPDTWRKPAEQQPKPDEAQGPRLGKASSAMELAQAFSRSVSDPRISSQSLPGRTQVPFSRLTAQRQINGY